MSELKITGNPNPTVGKVEYYSVNQLLANSIPTKILDGSKPNPFEFPVEWSVHVLENGRWIKKEENNKTGNKVSYKFIQKSLERKGIRILAKKGEQTARLDVKPHNAESPKIDSIEFLDKQGKKPSKPLAYGQTLKARVHCLHMERRTVYATLWEDNDKSKENYKIETRFGTVIDGIVDIDFRLRPSAAKAGLDKDKTHKYYVTTVVNNKNMPSNPVNVKELEAPVPPYKKKTPIQQPNTPTAPISTNSGVGNVYITDINGQPIQGTYKSKKLKVWIVSKGLQGKEIKLTIYDEDVTTNDLIYHNNFKISKDLFGIEVHLDKLPVSKAGRLEGGIELFVDIEVLQNQTHTKSGVVNVDAKAFKQDSGAIVNTVLKIFDPSSEDEKKEENKNKCPRCSEDFKYDDIVKIFPAADKNKNLAEKLIKEINNIKDKYEINSCIRKAHLINQFGSETGFNTLVEGIDGYNVSTLKTLFGYFRRHPDEAETYKGNLYEIAVRAYGLRKVDHETDIISCSTRPGGKCNDLGNESKEDGYTYIGRGLIQLTGKYNYTQINKEFVKSFPGKGNLVNDPKLLEDPKYAVMSAFSYWINNKLNLKADLGSKSSDVDDVTKIINKNLDESHYEKRRKSFLKAKEVFRLSECKKMEPTDSNSESVTIRLVRKWQTLNSTVGEFTIDNSEISGFFLEEKGPDTTISGKQQRIPIGTYNLVSHSGTKFKNVLKLHNNSVNINRAILIHSGNSAIDTEGCLLAGSSRSVDWVSGSKDKLKEIMDYVTDKGIEGAKIIITQDYV
jgi:predicted chitinase